MNADLKWVLSCYGFTCPKNKEITTSEFIDCIEKSYDCSNVRSVNGQACVILKGSPLNKYLFEYTGNVRVRSYE